MARISRQELKQDEFVDTVDQALDYLERHGRALLTALLVLVLAGGSAGGYYWYSKKQEAKASAALGQALITFAAPVQAGLPPLPGLGPEKIFSSEEEKYQAAREEFAGVYQDYPGTQSGQLARQYQALCLWQLDDKDAAVAALEEVSRASDNNVAAVARFHLAGFYLQLGRTEDAKKLYRELADNPTATLPRATALLALADLLASEDPAEARRLLEEVRDEYSDTPIATQVSRRLELLPAPPAGGPVPPPEESAPPPPSEPPPSEP